MPARLQELETDVLVAGGGMAGVCAALAAARNGAQVVLLQDRSTLGGNASSEVRMHIVGADCHGARRGWRESGILEELRLEDAVRNPARCFPLWDLLLYEKVHAEPNLALLLDTTCAAVDMEGGLVPPAPAARTDRMVAYHGRPGRIRAVRALRSITEDEFLIRARCFVDCTGDGRLGAEAGADYRVGRESRSMHGESLAPEADDCQTLGSSILFTARRHDRPVPFTAPSWARAVTPETLRVGRGISTWEYGFWWAEWGGQIDSIRDHATTIRHELYAIALGVWDHIKNSGRYPDSAPWALDWIGCLPGKRESRRFLGPRILTQQDLEAGRSFEDDVAYGGWSIDNHPPSGIDAPDRPPADQRALTGPYGIPLRCLYSRNVENLLFAGRNISCSHLAFASSRVMGTCSVVGQAAGTAAAYCAAHALEGPAALSAEPEHVRALQQLLLKDDATLLRVAASDSEDLVRSARVKASSFAEGHPPERILDGWLRDEVDPRTGRLVGSHRWTSAAGTGMPQWLELRWPSPVPVHEVHLTFDTGFDRPLALTASDNQSYWGVRGPQPEAVRDYELRSGKTVLARITGNYQRKRVHRLDGSPLSQLRLHASATHGVPEARLFEIRVY